MDPIKIGTCSISTTVAGWTKNAMKSNRWTLSDYLRIGLTGFPPEGLLSIDVTYRCNLHCLHCYFSRQDYISQLSSDRWVTELKRMESRGAPLYICGWLGGEPLLRPEVIEAGRRFFKSSIIFTNGALGLPRGPTVPLSSLFPGREFLIKSLQEPEARPMTW